MKKKCNGNNARNFPNMLLPLTQVFVYIQFPRNYKDMGLRPNSRRRKMH